jgi:hypothetical protein
LPWLASAERPVKKNGLMTTIDPEESTLTEMFERELAP